jgi:hypothetical protein
MSIAVSTIEEILEESPDFIKVASDLGAATQAYEKAGGGLAGLLDGFAVVQANKADLVKAYNDIQELGVQKAIAAGTVVSTSAAT